MSVSPPLRTDAARRRLAETMRHLASGLLTNDQFEDGQNSGGDRATREIFWFAWGFYDDLHEHRLRGRHRLSPLQRRAFARCVLFLLSGLPYEWDRRARHLWCRQRCREDVPWWKPDESVFGGLPQRIPVVRAWGRRLEELRDRRLRKRGIVDDRIWPFRRMADYKAALKDPPYLVGRPTA